MLSHLPARDVDEPATKDFVRAELADLRATMQAELRHLLQWLIVSFVAIAGALITASRLLL